MKKKKKKKNVLVKNGCIIMTDDKMTFEKWSKMWDRLFDICVRRNDSRALLAHTYNYNPKWNRGE
ncbi:hypothetical protein LCGC14_2208270 [marine sediment metagenome]|uniref:Uncharacterized protein n=1 Tax=marine sediment metagenome TaxID=412755 RepID=A0A0F9FRX3_9ZZZZ